MHKKDYATTYVVFDDGETYEDADGVLILLVTKLADEDLREGFVPRTIMREHPEEFAPTIPLSGILEAVKEFSYQVEQYGAQPAVISRLVELGNALRGI